MKENITKHNYSIVKEDRQKQNKHNSFLLWFTGLSGSGKSTIANEIEQALYAKNIKTYTLDGDNIRKGINNDLTFAQEDRTENIRRIAQIANLFIDAGVVVLAAFVSPYQRDRENIKKIVKDVNFVEIYINTSIAECERRDVKGLYRKARAGEIKNMTGISAPYEVPKNPDIEIKTEEQTLEEAVNEILSIIEAKLRLEE